MTQTLQKLPGGASWNIETIGSTSGAWSAETSEVSLKGRFIAVGWAVDRRAKSAAGGVELSVDGALYKAQYGQPRPDVAIALGVPAYSESGFKMDIPAEAFSPGAHTVFFRVITNDQKSFWEMGPYKVVFK